MAKIPEFTDDMEIIQKLSDYPEQDMLTTSQFKACFDKAGILIKTFLNRYVVPVINDYVASNDGLLSVEGGTMKGSIYMSGNRITGLGDPIIDSDSSTKKYADTKLPKSGGDMTGSITMGGNKITGLGAPAASADAATKEYVDGKRFVSLATISADWSGDNAPYVKNVTVSGILASDFPHISPVYSGDYATALSERESWNMINAASSVDGAITFVCFEDKPTTAVTVLVEVMR